MKRNTKSTREVKGWSLCARKMRKDANTVVYSIIIIDLAWHFLHSRDGIKLSPSYDDTFELKSNENGLSDRPIVEAIGRKITSMWKIAYVGFDIPDRPITLMCGIDRKSRNPKQRLACCLLSIPFIRRACSIDDNLYDAMSLQTSSI